MSMKYKVEANVPMPPRRGRPIIYPFPKMRVSDSFPINGKRPATVYAAASRFAIQQDPEWRFSIRKTDDGYRCWRVE